MNNNIIALIVLFTFAMLAGGSLTYELYPRTIKIIEDHTYTITFCPEIEQ